MCFTLFVFDGCINTVVMVCVISCYVFAFLVYFPGVSGTKCNNSLIILILDNLELRACKCLMFVLTSHVHKRFTVAELACRLNYRMCVLVLHQHKPA